MDVTDERRDKLARVIDPDSWELYDDKRMVGRKIREDLVKDSRETADKIVDSGLMTNEDWDREEYRKARKDIINNTSRQGICYAVEDGMDGYVLHDPRCKTWPDAAIGPGKGCIDERSH